MKIKTGKEEAIIIPGKTSSAKAVFFVRPGVMNWSLFLKSIINLLNKNSFMLRDLLYIIAILLLIGWAIGVFGFAMGGLIHLLLVIAVVAVLLRLIQGKEPL
jgi:hypothetical protein